MAKIIWYQTVNERVSRMPYRWQHRAGSVAISSAIMTSPWRHFLGNSLACERPQWNTEICEWFISEKFKSESRGKVKVMNIVSLNKILQLNHKNYWNIYRVYQNILQQYILISSCLADKKYNSSQYRNNWSNKSSISEVNRINFNKHGTNLYKKIKRDFLSQKYNWRRHLKFACTRKRQTWCSEFRETLNLPSSS